MISARPRNQSGTIRVSKADLPSSSSVAPLVPLPMPLNASCAMWTNPYQTREWTPNTKPET